MCRYKHDLKKYLRPHNSKYKVYCVFPSFCRHQRLIRQHCRNRGRSDRSSETIFELPADECLGGRTARAKRYAQKYFMIVSVLFATHPPSTQGDANGVSSAVALGQHSMAIWTLHSIAGTVSHLDSLVVEWVVGYPPISGAFSGGILTHDWQKQTTFTRASVTQKHHPHLLRERTRNQGSQALSLGAVIKFCDLGSSYDACFDAYHNDEVRSFLHL